MMEKAEGTIEEVAGRVQDAIGGATGDAGLQAEGKFRQAAGKIQQGYGAVLGTLRDAATSNPLSTIAVVATVSFMLGAIWARRD